ncbi:MAG TPA: hypothetical protein VJN94_14350 [Candidatus Binataceae bacterium]|nr:hypothetical protein [Candidatus Binataceae bacterium]
MPPDGSYDLLLVLGAGGTGFQGSVGGLGAEIQDTFSLTAGALLLRIAGGGRCANGMDQPRRRVASSCA